VDIFARPDVPSPDLFANLGPLRSLAGTWEGSEGLDTAPDAHGPVETRFRERLVLEPCEPIVNGPQVLYALRYATTAWPLGQQEPFHEEVGYWLFEPAAQQLMRCFTVPRGVTLIAGGSAQPDVRSFELTAEAGASTFGILQSPFLESAFRTLRYTLQVDIEGEDTFRYTEDTVMRLHGQDEDFHHTDRNRLQRVA
jgi:hypothetical protein